MRLRFLTPVAVALLVATSCGGETGAARAGDRDVLTVYSGRDEAFMGPLFGRFTEETGVELEVRYGDSAELAATILEEGESSPADVFVAQDAGSLGAVAEAGLLAELDREVLRRVDKRFRSPEGLWVGTSGRARVAVYNTDVLSGDDMPGSIVEFTEPSWRGRIGFPPTNASFQAFVAAMIQIEGEDATRDFLEGLQANEPTLYPDNVSTVRGVAAGEVDVGFVNHYYLYVVTAEDGEIPVANHFFTGGDLGALVNVAGASILETADHGEDAALLVDYLTGDGGQSYFAQDTFEFPVARGFEPRSGLVPLEEIESPQIDLSDLGGTLEPALQLLAEVGLL